jgi:hypothetical protein
LRENPDITESARGIDSLHDRPERPELRASQREQAQAKGETAECPKKR